MLFDVRMREMQRWKIRCRWEGVVEERQKIGRED
jgi:hypothetical protein